MAAEPRPNPRVIGFKQEGLLVRTIADRQEAAIASQTCMKRVGAGRSIEDAGRADPEPLGRAVEKEANRPATQARRAVRDEAAVAGMEQDPATETQGQMGDLAGGS